MHVHRINLHMPSPPHSFLKALAAPETMEVVEVAKVQAVVAVTVAVVVVAVDKVEATLVGTAEAKQMLGAFDASRWDMASASAPRLSNTARIAATTQTITRMFALTAQVVPSAMHCRLGHAVVWRLKQVDPPRMHRWLSLVQAQLALQLCPSNNSRHR